jgi:hypothetical protein
MHPLLKDPNVLELSIEQSERYIDLHQADNWHSGRAKWPGASSSIEPLLTGSITCLKRPKQH